MKSEHNKANGYTKVNEFINDGVSRFEVLVARKGLFTLIKGYPTDPRGDAEVAKLVKAAGGDLSKAKYFLTDWANVKTLAELAAEKQANAKS